jgi:hypothetical protein
MLTRTLHSDRPASAGTTAVVTSTTTASKSSPLQSRHPFVSSTQSETVTSSDFVSLSRHLFSLADNQAWESDEAGAGADQVGGPIVESVPQDTTAHFYVDPDAFVPERGAFDLPTTFDDFFDLASYPTTNPTNDTSLLPLDMLFVTR